MSKAMYEYPYVDSHLSSRDPRFYENVDIMHDKETCTVWALHMNITPDEKDAVLERMSQMADTTGEYTYGDSWTEWGVDTDDDSNRHMVIYFDAAPDRAAQVGMNLANHAVFAALRGTSLEGQEALLPYAVSTSGDYAEQLEDLT